MTYPSINIKLTQLPMDQTNPLNPIMSSQ